MINNIIGEERIREIIEKAIIFDGSVLIEYSKDGEPSKLFQLGHIRKYGVNCICGIPLGYSSKELIFRIDHIKSIEMYWTDFLENATEVNESGLYLVACRGDNHLEHIFVKYKKGEMFHNPYFSADIPIAYHYIPPYSPEDTFHWKKDCISPRGIRGVFVVAYTMREPLAPNKDDYCYNYHDQLEWKWQIPSISQDYNQSVFGSEQEIDGIHYSLGLADDKSLIRGNIDVLAYHRCSLYTEANHLMHNYRIHGLTTKI